MIPVTDEMTQVFWETARVAIPWRIRDGLAAVLAIVERDHLRPAPAPSRCSACGRTARELRPLYDLVDGRSVAVAWLGPSCYRRAALKGVTVPALPIGGDR